ncbi:MAG: EamA family transporter RarD [Campylobacter sp.]|nr:EamA family transporter RarD [Campylobacter sp.]MBR0071432.1 EamA family transporter RarD [Campylobacter sp.]
MPKNSQTTALILGISTFVMWGVFPIYFKMLEQASALEVLAHRIIWSVVFLLIFIKYKNRIRNLQEILHNKKTLKTLFITGLFIASNWGIYIYAVNSDQILESGLGYFINPLFSMLLGAIFLKERLNLAGKISVFLVFIAIAIQIYSLGKLPFISIILPASFAIYGLLKKKLAVPSMEGLFVETMLLFPFALLYGLFLCGSGSAEFGLNRLAPIFIFSGIVTVLPLITFNLAAQKLSLSTLGFMQYISPTMQILIAVFMYGENLDFYKIISFIIIWIGIAIVSIDNLKGAKNG